MRVQKLNRLRNRINKAQKNKKLLDFNLKLQKNTRKFYMFHTPEKPSNNTNLVNGSLRNKRNKTKANLEKQIAGLKQFLKQNPKKELKKKIFKKFFSFNRALHLQTRKKATAIRMKQWSRFYVAHNHSIIKVIARKQHLKNIRKKARLKHRPKMYTRAKMIKTNTFWNNFAKRVKEFKRLNLMKTKSQKKSIMLPILQKTKMLRKRINFRFKQFKYKYIVRSKLQMHRPILFFSI